MRNFLTLILLALVSGCAGLGSYVDVPQGESGIITTNKGYQPIAPIPIKMRPQNVKFKNAEILKKYPMSQ